MWCIGAVLWELITGYTPELNGKHFCKHQDERELFFDNRILRKTPITEELKTVLFNCLALRPEDRWSLTRLRLELEAARNDRILQTVLDSRMYTLQDPAPLHMGFGSEDPFRVGVKKQRRE